MSSFNFDTFLVFPNFFNILSLNLFEDLWSRSYTKLFMEALYKKLFISSSVLFIANQISTKIFSDYKRLWSALSENVFFTCYVLNDIQVSKNKPIFTQNGNSYRRKHHKPQWEHFQWEFSPKSNLWNGAYIK